MIDFDLLYPKPKRSYGGNDRRDEMITIRTTEKTIKLFKKLQSNPNDPNLISKSQELPTVYIIYTYINKI